MKELKLIQSDPYLKPYARAIEGRYEYFLRREKELAAGKPLRDFADGYLYFGLHQTTKGWVLREWAPNATAIYMIGDMTEWRKSENYRLQSLGNGNWELELPKKALEHGQLYKLLVEWYGGAGERIPSYATRVVQDERTKIFSAQVWAPKPYKFEHKLPVATKRNKSGLFIYECHIGMGGNAERVSTYEEFRQNVLPRVEALGYNCIQIMAIQEHPYYGSFGYHVSNFFAASSRFGTPEELKALIDDAHGRGIAVIMDLVHSHAVKNEQEGLGNFDGTPYQYFHDGARREHPAWDSLCFDYQKPQVIHFLLSNCKFWLDEYNFDGFRFDGVTSMIYRSHGLGEDFNGYDSYYNMNQDGDAICYLTLANKLIHQVKKSAVTIAEEMSGMPGLAAPIKDGGMGFDYRLAMGIPDFWIKIIKEVKDEDWKAGHILYEMTNRRQDEKTISYAESHDQALVGDKTMIFRFADAAMYDHMGVDDHDMAVDRAMALHKMIRLLTMSAGGNGYLTFMGNEFGHPEWIDFPRPGNGNSFMYCRRQWSLMEREDLKYRFLNHFDKDMILTAKYYNIFAQGWPEQKWVHEDDHVIAYERGGLLFVFNFAPSRSYTDYLIPVSRNADYEVLFSSDDYCYGGYGRVARNRVSASVPGREYRVSLYLPARTAIVLCPVDMMK